MTLALPSRQRGAALLAMLAVFALGTSWYLVSRLNAESGLAAATTKERNAEVLNRAKLALIGYVAAQAAKAMPYPEDNPGALPCPEHAWYISLTAKEGGAGPSVGVANPGYGTANCSSIGRYPWRTIGTDKFVDASGEPLWYVVGPTWRKTSTSTKTVINSDTAGDLTADGQQVVALIIAPGPAIKAQAGTTPAGETCSARNQSRSLPAGTMDPLDYLECYNAATLQFSGTGPSASFNDQIVRVTAGDLMPAIEAAVARRIEQEIVPALNSVYTPAGWGFSGAKPLYPYAAPFASPGPGTGTSSYQGSAGTYAGLLPFNQTQGCTSDPANPRCLPNLITWNGTPSNATETYGYGYIQTMSCYWVTVNIRECFGEYHENNAEPFRPIRIEMSAVFNNVALGLRKIDTSKITVDAKDNIVSGPWEPQTTSYTVALDSNGRATLTFGATLPNIDIKGWGTYANFRIRIDRAAMGDHALLDPNDSTTGWFVRNQWYRLAYYAVAQGHTVNSLPTAPACTTGSNCLSVANVAPAGGQRAILVLAGRSVNASTRPNGTRANYFEGGNETGAYARKTVSASNAIPAAKRFNDRIVIVGSN